MEFKKLLVIGIEESALEDSFWRRIQNHAEELVFLPKESDRTEAELKEADGVLLNVGLEMGRSYIDAAPALRYIGVLATGFGRVDAQYAAGKGIVVTNVPGYSTEAVAEFTVAAMLTQICRLDEGIDRARTGNYSEAGLGTTEIRGKNFCILGLGNIGGRVAELAQAFGASVRYWSLHRKSDQEALGIRYGQVQEILAAADFISVNLALNPETEGSFSADWFGLLKKGAVVVNTAPMELVDIPALTSWLLADRGTFVLDHSDEMDMDDLKRLAAFPNCVIYPPIANITQEASMAKKEIFTANLEAFAAGRAANRVN